MLLYQVLASMHGKILKSYTKTMELKYLGQRGKKLNHHMDYILYQIFKIILSIK